MQTYPCGCSASDGTPNYCPTHGNPPSDWKPKAYFIFDVESIGLHGEAFAVAGGVYLENGAAQNEFCFCCPRELAAGEAADRKWIDENVPSLGITHPTPWGMRQAFWAEWMRAKKDGAEMAVECGWPVEANFLEACIKDSPAARNWDGPYPLHEIATMMKLAGRDPMATVERTESEKPAHNPLADARLSARILSECIKHINKLFATVA